MNAPTHPKPLTSIEVANVASQLQPLVGAQLQECLLTENEFALGFYHQGGMFWLWIDLKPQAPLIVRRHGSFPVRKKIVRPLVLFLRSRFLGRRLAEVRVGAPGERILVFAFHRAKDEEEQGLCEVEVRLIPHGANIIARDGRSSVAERKPQELPPPQMPSPFLDQPRSWEEIETDWLATRAPKPVRPDGQAQAAAPAPAPAPAPEREWQKALEKKRKILERLHEELESKTKTPYAELGEWLKAHATLAVPDEYRELIDPEKGLSWNIEESFRKAKENVRKAEGTRARRQAVARELEELEKNGPQALKAAAPKAPSLLERSEARGRRFEVAPDLEAYIGKSAADNLALLRRAQPFDYWLHLRERPGAHAILRRGRGRVVTDAEFAKVGVWVAEQSLKKRAADLKGERFDLLIVECRYVRPIKGDKLGRVHYTHDRVLTLRL